MKLIYNAIQNILTTAQAVPVVLAAIRNLGILTIIHLPFRALERRLSTVFLDRVQTELCLPYSHWLQKILRKKLKKRGFERATFSGLCYAFPGRYLLDIFQHYRHEIEKDPYCLQLLIRRGLEPHILHDTHDARFSQAETYGWTLHAILETLLKGGNPDIIDWVRWYASTPPLIGGEQQRVMAEQFRQLERIANPLLEPTFQAGQKTASHTLRAGLFRYNYSPAGEVDLLPGLLAAMPATIEFFFLGFAEPPKHTINDLPYVQLNGADVAAAIREARALNLDVVIFSPPLWGNFCAPMSLLIENRIAPVQIYYLGDVSTSGLNNLDYFLFPADMPLDKYQPAFSEKLLPVTWGLSPTPPLFANTKTAHMDSADGTVTYVTNCHIGKINGTLIRAWVDILRQVPGSRILLCPYANPGQKKLAPLLQRLIDKECSAKGVYPKAFVISDMSGPLVIRDVLASGQVYLDTYPYTGSFSTAEAIRAGLPSVCLVGNAYHSQLCRMVAALVDVENDVIVHDMESYIRRAVALGLDSSLRKRISQNLSKKLNSLSLEDMNRQFSEAFWKEVANIS